MLKDIRVGENFHIVLWLFKDVCWCMDLKLLGTVMIAPTLSVAAWLTWHVRKDRGEFLHALAVTFWIAANSVWMIGEFFFSDSTRPWAMVFFFAGMACVGWYYLVERPKAQRRAATGQ